MELDAVVVGGNVRGLVAAHMLDSLGFRTLVVERAPFLGGADGSFRAADGTRFEYGMHVLDEDRSPLATRLFRRAVEGRFHRVRLERGLVLRGEIVPYAPRREELPSALGALLPEGELVDDLGNDAPTRERLARCYGRPWCDLVFDEVLPSYPSEHRHAAFGVAENELVANVYPWFFPRARRQAKSGDESRAFHDRLRAGEAQYLLYPAEGGFGGFVEGLARQLDPERVELRLGCEARFEVDPATHSIVCAQIENEEVHARHWFWAGPWPALCHLLELPCQETSTDRIFVGSFRFDRPASCAYNELLVGDPALALNRVYFPARFRESEEPLLQVEYALPEAADPPTDPEVWRERWLADLERIGLLDGSQRVELFDFKTRVMHFNGFGMEGERLRDADPGLLHPAANLHPLVPSMANLNLNSHVPRTVAQVAAVLAGED